MAVMIEVSFRLSGRGSSLGDDIYARMWMIRTLPCKDEKKACQRIEEYVWKPQGRKPLGNSCNGRKANEIGAQRAIGMVGVWKERGGSIWACSVQTVRSWWVQALGLYSKCKWKSLKGFTERWARYDYSQKVENSWCLFHGFKSIGLIWPH